MRAQCGERGERALPVQLEDVSLEIRLLLGAARAMRALELGLLAALKPRVAQQRLFVGVGLAADRARVATVRAVHAL